MSPKPKSHDPRLVIVRGAGDLASGVILRLVRSGFRVIALEVAQPLAVRRTVSFSEAMYEGEAWVEGLGARKASGPEACASILEAGEVALLEDPQARILDSFAPLALVDAIMAKRNLDTRIDQAPLVLALGPGFVAGQDCHAVIETKRGHDLGRVIWSGQAEANTGRPGMIEGRAEERVLRAPLAGRLETVHEIGDIVEEGEVLARVQGPEGIGEVKAGFKGLLRGMLRSGLEVPAGLKIGDLDPRRVVEHCYTVSDKSRAIAGGVLEALLAGRAGYAL